MGTPEPRVRNIAELKANILQPSLTSTYECSFVFPSAVIGWANGSTGVGNRITIDTERKLTLSCRSASLPGTSLATHTLDNDFTGVTERHAYRRQYDTTASFTFYVDVNYDTIYMMENWIKFIVNEDTSDFDLDNRNYCYRVNFPNEYKSDIRITKFEKDYKRNNLEYKFINAYPISIDTMPLSYDASQVLECTVNFNFSRYIIKSNRFTSLEEIRAFADDTGRSLEDSQGILRGTIETLIE